MEQARAFRAVSVTAHRLSRGTWKWGAEADQAYTALLLRSGGTVSVTSARTRGAPNRQTRLREAVLLHSEQEATLWFGGQDAACFVIWVPHELLTGLGLSSSHPVSLGASTLVSAARAFVAASLRTDGVELAQQSKGEDQVMERLLLGLVIGVFVESGVTHREFPPSLSQIEQAHSLILAHLRDPAYNSETLAHHLRMSPRQVQRLFAKFGTTPSETLRRFRAELAESLLNERDRNGATIGEIAERAGFRSTAAMRRALQAQARVGEKVGAVG